MTTTTFVTGVTVIEADWLNDVDATTYGTRPVALGGTGGATPVDARTNLGLGNVDNTADSTKPVSMAQQTALDLKANLAGPALTGIPTAPTAAVATNTAQIATTAHVFAERTAAATLTNKTLVSPTISGSFTLPAVTLSGAVSGGAQQVDNVVIGANTPLAGSFTTLSSSGVATLSSGLIVPKTTGTGIKVDPAAPTFPWKNAYAPIDVRGSGANDPTFAVFGATSIRAFSFSAATMNECFVTFVMPHDILAGSALYMQCVWSNAAAAPNTGNVIWAIDYTYAKSTNQAAFPATANIALTQASPATRYQNNTADLGPLTVSGVEPDGTLLARVYRDAAAGGDTCTDAVFLLNVVLSYQSTGVGTKSRALPFYS